MEELGSAPTKTTHKKWKLWLIVVAAIVVVGYGVLGWLLVQAQAGKSRAESEKSQLQKKNDELTKQLAEKNKASDTPASDNKPTTATVTQAMKDNIAAAVTSHNYAALEGYMASSVNVVVAASEKAGPRTPAQAISDMAYLNGGTLPWNFALPAATLASYRAGFYSSYLGASTLVGESANHMVVSFGFDSSAKINVVFMAADSGLLL